MTTRVMAQVTSWNPALMPVDQLTAETTVRPKLMPGFQSGLGFLWASGPGKAGRRSSDRLDPHHARHGGHCGLPAVVCGGETGRDIDALPYYTQSLMLPPRFWCGG